VKTDAAFLAQLLAESDFAAGAVDTNFIAAHQERLTAVPPLSEDAIKVATHVLVDMRNLAVGDLAGSGFRLNAKRMRSVALDVDGERLDAALPRNFDGLTDHFVRFMSLSTQQIVKFDAGHAYRVGLYQPRGSGDGGTSDGSILSPMPGRIIAVDVTQGQSVTKGQKLLTLEAMKMEHSLVAPFDGIVAELNAETGTQVQVEAVLVRIEPRADKAG
jgi:3-methylcrotonyl-CoA carboxylase alpha subunit